MTLLNTAVNGWTDYTQHGKFAALFLVAILYLGMTIRRRNERTVVLWIYAGLTALACICPVTAIFLMKYQTAFYSYVWIWAIVPETALIAWAATEFLSELWKKKTLKNIVATLILLGIVFLSGNPVSEWTKEQTAQTPALDEAIGQSCTLWAPKEVMAAARAYSADIYPVYGRSIWDASLGSYSYDTYETGQEDLYLWMSHLEATGETEYVRMDESSGARTIDFGSCLKYAAEKNVDVILLPGDLPEETVSELQKTAGSEFTQVAGYYLLSLKD